MGAAAAAASASAMALVLRRRFGFSWLPRFQGSRFAPLLSRLDRFSSHFLPRPSASAGVGLAPPHPVPAATEVSSSLASGAHRPSPCRHSCCGNRAAAFFSTSASSNTPSPPRFTNTEATFDWSDEDGDEDDKERRKKKEPLDKSKLPPPYDPFSKKPAIEEPKDPKHLQEIFHRMRTEGLTNHAVKMFDGLSKDGLTHEALALFAQIKDKGSMPDVVAHTAVIEAYANAGGHSKEALKTFQRMIASGVMPNAYTYSVFIRGLAADGKLAEAKKYVLEMMDKGIKPNAGTYVAVFEAFLKEENGAEKAKALLQEMRAKGFAPEEKAVREHLGRRGSVLRSIMSLLFGK